MENHNSYPGSEDNADDIPEREEPDEVTTEDVRRDLDRIDEELRAMHMLDAVGEPYGDEAIALSELSDEALERFTADLRKALARLGLADPHNFTAGRLKNLKPEVLLQLDEYAVECLYFDTAQKIWSKLGSEPVTTDILLSQLQPPNKPKIPATGVNLDNLRYKLKREGFEYLRRLGVAEDQLFEMMIGSPAQQQNVIRLSFLLQQETSLQDLRKSLQEEAEEPLRVEKIIDMIVVELRSYILQFNKELRELSEQQQMESIDYQRFNRATKQVRSSLVLADLIRKGMQVK